MENHDMLPFERNRYYPGKLLTSADFEAEQTYFNNKRRFINSLTYGAGVLCGLSVYSLDDLSIMIESGVAVDGYGRELVVEKSAAKKLSTLEGFEGLSSGKALLCLKYAEQPIHLTYAINRQPGGEEYELNRIDEGWALFLANPENVMQLPAIETHFYSVGSLYEDEDFLVQIFMPANISNGANVRLKVQVSRKSATAHVFEMRCLLQAPSFTTQDGAHELEIEILETVLAQGETAQKDYWLCASAQLAGETVVIAKPQHTHIIIDNASRKIEEAFLLKMNLQNTPVHEIVAQAVGSVSLEEIEAGGRAAYVPLAVLEVQINQNTYVVEKVDEQGVKNYLPTAAQEEMRREFNACFGSGQISEKATGDEKNKPEPATALRVEQPLNYATGMCEIPLGAKARKGDIFKSDEIMHGFGAGNVHIQIGFEYLTEDIRLDTTSKNTIYGDTDLFADEKPPVPVARTGVKVMSERGGFVVAMKLMKDTPYVVALVRWVATLLPSEGDKTLATRIAGKSISAVQPTVLLTTRESHFFDVKFRNMEPMALSYELTENESGEITSDGIYTAPGREGVYEVRIYCTELPLVSTYAYVIIKKRGIDAEPVKKGDLANAE